MTKPGDLYLLRVTGTGIVPVRVARVVPSNNPARNSRIYVDLRDLSADVRYTDVPKEQLIPFNVMTTREIKDSRGKLLILPDTTLTAIDVKLVPPRRNNNVFSVTVFYQDRRVWLYRQEFIMPGDEGYKR